MLDVTKIRDYCLSKSGASEHTPWDKITLVYKVNGKVFAILGLDDPPGINLKCDPEYALELREKYSFVKPGYHMNIKHWNTVYDDPFLSMKDLLKWIDHSYDLVEGRKN